MRARIVPVSRRLEVGAATPLDLFRRLRGRGRECFLLESVEGSPAVARYSFLGVDPNARVTALGKDVSIERDGELRRSREPLLETVAALTRRDRFERDPDLPPFCGGAVGYLAYDAVRQLEEIPDRHPRDTDAPDALFLRFDAVVGFDHRRNVAYLLTTAEEHDRSAAKGRLDC